MDAAPTIRTLAKLAGVSNATISLALRDHPRIRPGERARIKGIAAKAGYKKNAVVAHLLAQVRASKTSTFQSTLAMVDFATNPGGVKHRTGREWVQACEERAAELGYGLDYLRLYDLDFSPGRLVRILEARGIQGLVVAGPFYAKPIPPEFNPVWERSCPIVLGERPVQPALSCVLNNQFSTAALAMQEMIRLGYKRIGMCINPALEEALERRFHGGFYAIQAGQPAKDHVPVFDFTPDAADRFKLWVERHRPDGILTLHDDIKGWLEAMGRSVPGDVGLAHLGRTADQGGWAGTDQNNRDIGLAAVDMVVGQLHRHEFGAPQVQKCVSIGSTWMPGDTVREVAQRLKPAGAASKAAGSMSAPVEKAASGAPVNC